MQSINKYSAFLFPLFVCVFLCACSKQDEWLEKKSNKSDIVPSKLSDYQSLLDYDDGYMNANYPFLGQVGCDDYYVTYANWQAASVILRNAYVWAPDIYADAAGSDWNNPYGMVAYANICLDGIQKIDRDTSNAILWDNVKGSALFFRAQAYYLLAQHFAKQYDAATAGTDAGIPLRNSSDVNITSARASVADTYQQILSDLLTAENILPAVPAMATRPSANAARGLLARVYLAMQDYAKAGAYADKVLKQVNGLIDYNTLNAALTYPLPTYQTGNKEVLFYATNTLSSFHIANGIIDSNLYKSYAANDLRKTIFFKSTGSVINYRGQYTGVNYPFGGIAINEMYLIRAEASARQGSTSAALTDLNTLLQKRWKTGTYVSITATDASDALLKILTERRKELIFYGSARWEDLRRLNKDAVFAKTLTRSLNGQSYTLPPNDPRYALLIPLNEIRLSGIEQNPR